MVLLYITNGINGSGGLERVLAVKASLLAEEYDYEVHVLVLNNQHQHPFYDFSSEIKFHSIEVGGNPLAYIRKYRCGIRNIVEKVRPDIISVCDDGLKGFFIPKIIKNDAIIIYERHVSKLIEAREGEGRVKGTWRKIKWFLMERLGKRFSSFVVLTEGNKNEWQRLDNIIVIPNPLPFESSEASTLENKIVICVGKISFQKGQDLLQKAWAGVHQKYPEWELHWYGKEDLDFLDTRNLEHNIHYFRPEKDIQKKYLDASIYVMSSRFEGFGMVLIEAMEFGLPCVSFNCDYGPSDIIEDGVDGFLVEKENTEQLAEKLRLLIQDKELRKTMGAKAKDHVKRFNAQRIVEQWDTLFKELTAGRKVMKADA